MTYSSRNYFDTINMVYPTVLRQIRCSTDFTEQPKERRYRSSK